MKNLRQLILLVLVGASCQSTSKQPDSINPGEENEKLIRQFYTHFNRHEWPQMAALYSDQPAMKDPSLGIHVLTMSRADIIKKYTELQQVFPDIHDSIIRIYHSENHVIVEFESRGTASDSTTFRLPICTIFEIKQGKIVSDYTYYDNF